MPHQTNEANGDDDNSFSLEGSTTPTTTDAEPSSKEEAKTKIGEKENKRVVYSRVLVIAVLAISVAVTGYFVYSFMSDQEQSSFESDFQGIAAEIIEVSQQGEQSLVDTMEEFSTLITASALATNQTWPYVTIDNFERRAAASRKVSGAYTLQITLSFNGDNDTQAKYNKYLDDNMGWYYEATNITGITPGNISKNILTHNPKTGQGMPLEGEGPFMIFSQYSPPPSKSSFRIKRDYAYAFIPRWNYMQETKRRARSPVLSFLNNYIEDETFLDPVSLYYQPIFKDFGPEKELVAFATASIRWQDYFTDLLHDSASGIIVVLNSTCDQVFTYEINGPNATYLGAEDLHDPNFEDVGILAGLTIELDEILGGSVESNSGLHCGYAITVYPSQQFRSTYDDNEPLIYTGAAITIFAFTTIVFVLYDLLVQRRQKTVMSSAVRSDAIVSSLFPAQFRDQLLEEQANTTSTKDTFHRGGAKGKLQKLISADELMQQEEDGIFLASSKPVADLFPEATVLFGDISGFTAWSSIREPTQVFTLLESIYRSMDNIAKRRGVFKVETVGDSYVAVAGVPRARKDHAVVMTRFARDCMQMIPKIVLQLERVLGPGTGDLRMRFGLHSGQVTAGVLRGNKARFQLFGDTVNTAARIESTGTAGRVHMSEETANLLIAAGKSAWVEKRQDIIHAKGKGKMQTYWLQTSTRSGGSVKSGSKNKEPDPINWGATSLPGYTGNEISKQVMRLVDWNQEQLLRLLKQVVAARAHLQTKTTQHSSLGRRNASAKHAKNATVLDEVTEIIMLPRFDSKSASNVVGVDPESVDLGPVVEHQLYVYIAAIAKTYRNNPFHNFEHASHVAMSVNKLLSRIVAPNVDVDANESDDKQKEKYAACLHDHTYGITSDPLTHLAVVISALIHDVDHRGVPNGQLSKEDRSLAAVYNNKSIAEQNSVDIAWAMLMQDEYKELRACIYSNEDEKHRFRQIIVNSVMATDIFDKELSTLRKNRWNKAFHETAMEESKTKAINRKATIVIEHIIQASDVSHTMQHWHVYVKWNQKLFHEMYLAYKFGRAEKDPSDGWYEGELWFFDCYVIPLAKKLAECGVFGVSSDEYLAYAVANRDEWASKGKDIVAAMVGKHASSKSEASQSLEEEYELKGNTVH